MRRVYDNLGATSKSVIDELVDEGRIESTLEMLRLDDVKDLVGLAERIEELFGEMARKPGINPNSEKWFDIE